MKTAAVNMVNMVNVVLGAIVCLAKKIKRRLKTGIFSFYFNVIYKTNDIPSIYVHHVHHVQRWIFGLFRSFLIKKQEKVAENPLDRVKTDELCEYVCTSCGYKGIFCHEIKKRSVNMVNMAFFDVHRSIEAVQ